MSGVECERLKAMKEDFAKVMRVLETCDAPDKTLMVGKDEFKARHSEEPLGHQIVNMLDLALRGVCNYWDDVIIPGFDFMVVENTFGKFGTRVECFNNVPINIQHLVGKAE